MLQAGRIFSDHKLVDMCRSTVADWTWGNCAAKIVTLLRCVAAARFAAGSVSCLPGIPPSRSPAAAAPWQRRGGSYFITDKRPVGRPRSTSALLRFEVLQRFVLALRRAGVEGAAAGHGNLWACLLLSASVCPSVRGVQSRKWFLVSECGP